MIYKYPASYWGDLKIEYTYNDRKDKILFIIQNGCNREVFYRSAIDGAYYMWIDNSWNDCGSTISPTTIEVMNRAINYKIDIGQPEDIISRCKNLKHILEKIDE